MTEPDLPLTDQELDDAVRLLGPIVYERRSARRQLQRRGITVTRSDFYSEIPTIDDIEAPECGPDLSRVFPSNDRMLDRLAELDQFAEEFDPPTNAESQREFAWNGGAFSFSDAMAYYCMIRMFRSRMIVEIGAGFSTLVARKALDRNDHGRLIAIEPYPSDMLRAIPGLELWEQRIQDVDIDALARSFTDDDILFVDSTHTVRYGSDVLNIYLDLVPRIPVRVHIHAHDIYLPRAFPKHMMLEHQVYWGEQYLLYAYLLGNDRARVRFGSRYHLERNPGQLAAFMRGRFQPGGASLWFTQERTEPASDVPPTEHSV